MSLVSSNFTFYFTSGHDHQKITPAMYSVLASLGSWVAVRGRLGGRVILHEAPGFQLGRPLNGRNPPQAKNFEEITVTFLFPY